MKPDDTERIDAKSVILHEKQYQQIDDLLERLHRPLLGCTKMCKAREPGFAEGAVLLSDALQDVANRIKICVLLPKSLENHGVSVDFNRGNGTALETVRIVAAASFDGATN